MSHLLIADDDEYLAQLYAQAFERAGYRVTKVHDGQKAIEILNSDTPDLILLDIFLPSIDGIEVLKFIRSNPDLKKLPVYIISSSSHFSGVVQTAWSEGATNFIQKGSLGINSIVDEIRKAVPPEKNSKSEPNQNLGIDYHTRIEPIESGAPPKAKNILIADDDKVIHGVLSYFLGQDGFKVQSAFDGSQSIELAHKDKPSVLVLDVSMPNKGGFETLEEWKNDSDLKDIPVIMLTASNDEAMQRKALELGAARYLTKPFSPDSLVQLANELIS